MRYDSDKHYAWHNYLGKCIAEYSIHSNGGNKYWMLNKEIFNISAIRTERFITPRRKVEQICRDIRKWGKILIDACDIRRSSVEVPAEIYKKFIGAWFLFRPSRITVAIDSIEHAISETSWRKIYETQRFWGNKI